MLDDNLLDYTFPYLSKVVNNECLALNGPLSILYGCSNIIFVDK